MNEKDKKKMQWAKEQLKEVQAALRELEGGGKKAKVEKRKPEKLAGVFPVWK